MSTADRAGNRMKHKRISKKQDSSKPSINPLKKRRRDLQRLLDHSENLPADVRLAQERELESCNHELEIAAKNAKRSQMIGRFHRVRFFERKKAERALKKAKKNLAEASSSADRNILEAKVHQCEVDLKYTQYYPLDVRYVSLYAGQKDQDESVNRDDPMWKVVETEMANGRLKELREGNLAQQLSNRDEHLSKATSGVKSSSTASKIRISSRNAVQKKGKDQAKTRPSLDEQSTSDLEDGAAFFE